MELIPDLCLIKILEHLSLPDQIAMLQTYERCRPFLGSIWRRRLDRIALNLLEVPIQGEDFRMLLNCACQGLREIRISYMDRDHFEALVGCRYPNLDLLQVDALPPFALRPRLRHQLRQIMPKSIYLDNPPTMGCVLQSQNEDQSWKSPGVWAVD